MAASSLVALLLLLQREPAATGSGEMNVAVGPETFKLTGISFQRHGQDRRTMDAEGKPGVRFVLLPVGSSWVGSADPQEVWLSPTRGGRVLDLRVQLARSSPRFLKGQFVSVLDENGQQTWLRGDFDLPERSDRTAASGPVETHWLNALVFALALFLAIGSICCNIWLIIVAFRENVGWGLACLCLPLGGLIFVVLHWDEAKVPFLGGILFYLAATAVFALSFP